MSFVPTGFLALDQMISGNGDCKGFPRGGLTLLGGNPGGGKSQLMRKCCARAHKRGLSVVYLTSEEDFKAEYPVLEIVSLDEVGRLVAHLLHHGKIEKTDLLVLDSLSHMLPDSRLSSSSTPPLASHARQLGQLFRGDFNQTAVVATFQSRRGTNGSPSLELGHRASVILGVSNSNSIYRLELIKSKVSHAGVSCEIRPTDMDDFDRSKILTRYQRILRGQY
jgi:hypothetical protein